MLQMLRRLLIVCYFLHSVDSTYKYVHECFWYTTNPCFLQCMAGDSELVAESIASYYEQTEDQCHDTGITIKIGSGVQFAKRFVMTAKWLRITDVPITELIVDCRDLNEIETDAFATEAFSRLTDLTLEGVNEDVFTKHSLRGLHKLGALRLVDFSAKTLRAEVFNEVSATLDELYIWQQTIRDAPLVLDSVLGTTTTPLAALNRVQIYRNLQDTLSARTFTGLVNITHLDLSRCQITAIGVGVFEPIAETIREVNLQLNLLTTLPAGVLDSLVLRPIVRILLQNNQWACDCELCYTKWAVTHGQNAGLADTRCQNPTHLRGELISAIDICSTTDCDSYVLCDKAENMLQPFCALAETTTTTDANGGGVHQQCYDGDDRPVDEIVLPARKYALQLQQVSKSSVAVQIDTDDPTSMPQLIWFENNYTDNTSTSCVGCTQIQFNVSESSQPSTISAIVVVTNIQVHVGYIFCVTQGNRSNMSPLDCVPYVNAKRDLTQSEGWLQHSDRPFSISMMVLAVVSSLLLGFCLGYMTMRCCNNKHSQSDRLATECGKLAARFDARRVSVCSTESYATPAVNLSRFDIIRRKLDKQATENQYYLENMPEFVAPRPPSTDEPQKTNQNDNIYADVGSYYKRF